jgi:tRNA modification GTPase
MSATDTIVALSTPAGESAVALIRLSGPDCVDLGPALLGRSEPLSPRHAYYGPYRALSGKTIDSCVLTYFAEGHSFTGAAMLEIAPHGNPLVIQLILEDLLSRGCRLAEPGEFTRTAFLNGRMDLTQAEAVADLIHARSERSLELARRQLHGSVGRKMSALTDQLLQIMAHLEAYIDFPEEDLPAEDQAGPAQDLRALIGELKALMETQHYAALLHEGVKTLIVGEPNVGKSSLINALVGSERAIVSDQPGTTRDYLSAFIMLGPWRIEILDTAGLHEGAKDLESIGIERTMEQSETADCFLLVLDSTAQAPTLPDALLEKMTPENTLVLENKVDLETDLDGSKFLPELKHYSISAKHGTGLSEFKTAWIELLETYTAPLSAVDGLVLNARHAAALSVATDALQSALEKMASGELSELIAADLRQAVESIGDVVGRVDNERMLDRLFKQFCIGK